MASKLKVLILGHGGTIAMVPGAKGALEPAKTIDEILAIVPTLQEMADVSFRQLDNRDSTNIHPSHWTKLAMEISGTKGGFDGIIITHGTDTMAYTASAVSLALGAGLKVPVVFTGSQLPLIEHGTDARFNLENAMKTIIEANEASVVEVMIVFSHFVLRASRSIKTSEARFDAFDSPAFPHLAEITAAGVKFIPQAFRKEGGMGNLLGDGEIKPHFHRGILSVEIVPGLEPDILFEILRSGKCQGLLFKSLGAGNIPSKDEFSLLSVIKAAIETFKIPVLVSTKFVGGNTRMDLYEPGMLALQAGAIPTGDMTDVMAQVKFMWALAQGHRSSNDLRKVMATNFVGEITA